ncbi:MAG: hypothetical protein JW893_09700 [Candidatus Omnitrophica bacterium]|nr:hypothetical protein [Candidatus Omnitrophota bacterium]
MNHLSRLLTNLLKPLIEIRPGERAKTLVMFVYFFLIIASVWILKPVRDSLFLEELGAKNLRYIYIAEAGFMVAIVWGFSQFARRVTQKVLYTGVLSFYIVCLLFFWILFHWKVPYLSFFFYIWVASYSIAMTTLFFTLANDIFNPQEARRLFGLILSGGSIGGVLGGLITEKLAVLLHTENLLLVVAVIISACCLLVGMMWKHISPTIDHAPLPNDPPQENKGKAEQTVPFPSAKKLFTGSSYLMMLAGLVMIVKISSAVVDNQFKGIVEASIIGLDSRTAFLGGFFKWLNAASFFSQLFLTSLALRYLGVGISLWILPVGLAIGSVFSFLNPILLTGGAIKLFDGSGNYSIQQACREVLYLPVPSKVRYRVKPVIDMLGFRIAKGLGGLYIAIFAPLLGLANERLSLLVLLLIPFWFILAWRMKKGYSKLLKERLVKKGKFDQAVKAQRATDVLSILHDEKGFHDIKAFMNHRSSYARKLAAAAYLAYAKASKDVGPARIFINQMIQQEAFDQVEEAVNQEGLFERDICFLQELLQGEVKEKVPNDATFRDYLDRHSESVLLKLGTILRDPDLGLAIKRRAVRLTEMIPKQESVDLLLHTLASAQEHAFRFVMIKALNRLQTQDKTLRMNRFLIKSEISREAKIHDKIQKIRYFYHQQPSVTGSEDYLEVALKAILEESLERIFYYLNLLYPEEGILVIFERIQEYAEDDPVRAHAVELLSNTVETDLHIIIHKILDGRKLLKVKERDIIEILKNFAGSQDRWFSITSYFLLSGLGLTQKWPELAELEIFQDLDSNPFKAET